MRDRVLILTRLPIDKTRDTSVPSQLHETGKGDTNSSQIIREADTSGSKADTRG
ncbi:hypothetical protein [Sporosarcina cyprini]|uniref:hypothetical protein n=1 Tax=Sporosarcina cyprini TaxID=2910523 RepID=UPI001EDD796C|nr:hypothetical protein [Sporosarcina cyprini]MCG3089730.1 hypothetical protein [Sporosarcina cyprini]